MYFFSGRLLILSYKQIPGRSQLLRLLIQAMLRLRVEPHSTYSFLTGPMWNLWNPPNRNPKPALCFLAIPFLITLPSPKPPHHLHLLNYLLMLRSRVALPGIIYWAPWKWTFSPWSQFPIALSHFPGTHNGHLFCLPSMPLHSSHVILV